MTSPTEDTPTPQGGLAHDTTLKAIPNQVAASLLEAELPWPTDVFGKVPGDDWEKIDKFATEQLGYRIDRISGDLMRRGWKVRQRQLQDTVTDLAKSSPETTSADTLIRPGEQDDKQLREAIKALSVGIKKPEHYDGRGVFVIDDLVDFIKSAQLQLVTELEGAARRSEEHYWIDYYSRQIGALDGGEDKPEKDRLKRLRKQHQDRVNDLIATDSSQDTVTPSRPGEHKKQELEGKQ